MNEPKGNPVSLENWEQQYKSGFWSYLGNSQEMARYAVIAAYIQKHSNGVRVLDVGCGEGVLWHHLHRVEGCHYTGIDLSPTALENSVVPEDKRTLIVADIDDYQFPSGAQFDAIIFNEVLSYPRQPVKALNQICEHLAPGGLIVVSLWHSPDPNNAYSQAVNGVWRAIDQGNWTGIDETAVTNIPTRRTWRIRAMNTKS